MQYLFQVTILILLVSSGFSLPAQVGLDERLVDVFMASSLQVQESTNAIFQDSYNPSGSSWSVSFNESEVFRSLLKYDHPTDQSKSYEMRLGKGGQVYSLKGAFGESVPPQWRNPNNIYGGDDAPWVDEVWQLVAVDVTQNDPANDRKYFIHGAGVYLRDPANINQPFYSVELASHYDAANQEYATVNWGQHAHIDENLAAGFTSSLLYYSKFKNLGDGIIQVDYLIYNFGNDVIGHMNVPWGGVRRSNLDHMFVSDSNNNYQEYTGVFGDGQLTRLNETNGWVAFSPQQNGNGPSLGILLNNENGLLRMGDAGDITTRNYSVYSSIRNGFSFGFGQTLRIRNYFIFDGSVYDIQAKISNLNLQSHTFFEFDSNLEADVESTSVFFEENNAQVSIEEINDSGAMELKLQPYQNSHPLFVVTGINSAGVQESRITSDLYAFSSLSYDGKTSDIDLIGFTDSKREVTIVNETIPFNSSYTFVDGTTLQNITGDLQDIRFSHTDANGYEHYIQTNLAISVRDADGYLWYEDFTGVENTPFTADVRSDFFTKVTNPNISAINENILVSRMDKQSGVVNPFIQFELPKPISCCVSHVQLSFKAYLDANMILFGSPNSNQRIRIILRNSSQGAVGQLISFAYFNSGYTWQQMEVDFTGSILPQNIAETGGYDQIVFFFDNTDLNATTSYYFDTVKGSFFESSASTSAIGLTPKTWNGNSWFPSGTPDISNSITIAADYNTALHGNLEVGEIRINANADLVVPASTCVFSQQEFSVTNNAEVDVEEEACLEVRIK